MVTSGSRIQVGLTRTARRRPDVCITPRPHGRVAVAIHHPRHNQGSQGHRGRLVHGAPRVLCTSGRPQTFQNPEAAGARSGRLSEHPPGDADGGPRRRQREAMSQAYRDDVIQQKVKPCSQDALAWQSGEQQKLARACRSRPRQNQWTCSPAAARSHAAGDERRPASVRQNLPSRKSRMKKGRGQV